MLFSDFVKDAKVTRVMNAQAAGTGDTLSSSIIDMQGFDSIAFVAGVGTLTATAVTSLKAQQGAAAAMGDAADLLGTSQAWADDDDNQVLILDLGRPRERYVRAQIVRATANAVVDFILAIQYNARTLPVTQDATTVTGSESHKSPAEGTA